VFSLLLVNLDREIADATAHGDSAMTTPAKSSVPLLSEFASDASMTSLVELFVGEMPGRIEALRAALSSGSLDALKRAAHQLKGAAGGYGFPTIGEAAGKVEALIQQSSQPTPEDKLQTLRAQVDQLTELCARARAAR